MTDVKAIAGWDGWCDPCGAERPLVLTEAGPRGLRAWMAGASWEDRALGLYCRVCGEHQVVPLHEEDDPVVVVQLPELVTALTRAGATAVVVARALAASASTTAPGTGPTAAVVVPAPRASAAVRPGARATRTPTSIALPDTDTALALVAAGVA